MGGMRVLLLGGTTEAGLLARALADARIDTVYSYAGRTDAPVPQPVPVRVGGFGGIAGLADYLRAQKISHLVDATHPFAAQISAHAVAATDIAGVPLIAFERAPWQPGPGDRWTEVPDTEAAVAALPAASARVFLATGRQGLSPFVAKPQHWYLLRLVDPPDTPLPLPQAQAEVARGPFTVDGDVALLGRHRIDVIVAKNAGGAGARAKLDAARVLGLPVILIDRPTVPERPVALSVEAVMGWLHGAPPDTDRGV